MFRKAPGDQTMAQINVYGCVTRARSRAIRGIRSRSAFQLATTATRDSKAERLWSEVSWLPFVYNIMGYGSGPSFRDNVNIL
jgi:hypothetical protein